MAEKNKYGQYFTIPSIAKFMVSQISHSKSSRVLEPGCGRGVFLDQLVDKGYNNITAYEIDSSLGAKYDFINFKSFISVPTSEKYDVVIGNPPYIRWKNIEKELKAELENNFLWNKYFNSLCDYLFIFILKSIEHLNDGGELIFICSEYWMNTTHSASLRNYMCAHGYFSEIYHFKEAPLFEGVTASFIIFRYVKSNNKENPIKLYQYTKKGVPSTTELTEKSCFNLSEIPQFKEDSRWILASGDVQKHLLNFEKKCRKSHSKKLFSYELNRIGDFCDIGNGMVSGLDAAFKFDANEVSKLNKDERDALISVLKAKDIDAYINHSDSKYIFIQDDINVSIFVKKYPYFAQHFKPYLERLSERYSYNREIPYWEFVFPRNQKLFERKEPRIFVPCKERISNKNHFRFCYANRGVYPTQDVTAILRKDVCKESLEYILAYLNNKRIFEWLTHNGIIKGEIVEFSEAPLASIPFRAINWDSAEEVAIHDKITEETSAFVKDRDINHIDTIDNQFNLLFNE